jgi:DNA-binding IclR family transcriptional regulator
VAEQTPVSPVDLAAQVRAMYTRRTGVVLSLNQVATLLGISDETCAEVMTTLVRERFLRCSARGEYVLR